MCVILAPVVIIKSSELLIFLENSSLELSVCPVCSQDTTCSFHLLFYDGAS